MYEHQPHRWLRGRRGNAPLLTWLAMLIFVLIPRPVLGDDDDPSNGPVGADRRQNRPWTLKGSGVIILWLMALFIPETAVAYQQPPPPPPPPTDVNVNCSVWNNSAETCTTYQLPDDPSTEFDVRWTASSPSTIVTHYEVYTRLAGSSNSDTVAVGDLSSSGPQLLHTLGGLLPGTTYTVGVIACQTIVIQSFSQIACSPSASGAVALGEHQTSVPVVPDPVKSLVLGDGPDPSIEINVIWEVDNAPPQFGVSYHIDDPPTAGTNVWIQSEENVTSYVHTLGNLGLGTAYTVTVVACTDDADDASYTGTYPPSYSADVCSIPVFEMHTTSTESAMPVIVAASHIGRGRISIEWNAPADTDGGTIVEYNVLRTVIQSSDQSFPPNSVREFSVDADYTTMVDDNDGVGTSTG